ncbi:MAG: SWF/SNF helicase family protein, partial [Firmicutes bacterium]|nr:SWF/SNF helicase family protein [Bacillota bacterium]
RGSSHLFKTSLEKSLFSSPAACIKSIDARLAKLNKKYGFDEIKDIGKLESLRDALQRIKPQDFSRYQKLLELLRSSEYGWDRNATDDRLVIFTERIETMKYLAEHLREDLSLPTNVIQEISGGMSDVQQQEIVENFGRTESPVRVLVASDVASEGLNLHYLSHRLIHFDIPWSLMVFQQRNGRIDRYGQQKRPDIRYFMIESDNKRIKGDMRIIEILITKEEQALKNIGDPALLLGKFTIEDEELVVIDAIENGADADAFEMILDNGEEEFDPFEELMRGAEEAEEERTEQAKTVSDETLFTDIDYLTQALSYLNQSESHPVEKLNTVSGVDIKISEDMRRRLRALMPEEALPQGETLRLSDDTKFVMDEMRRSMQNNMADTAWPKTQYLWSLHPIFTWVNDKAGLLFDRGQAPIVGLSGSISMGEMIFVISGSIPNQKSTPLVDEWFGLVFIDGKYVETIDMHEVIRRTGIRNGTLANIDAVTESKIAEAESLREVAVAHAREFLGKKFREYQNRMNPLLNEEVDKLADLQVKHHNYYQQTLFEHERKLEEKERSVDELFEEFINWVTETLTIQDNPYIRIITVLTGVAS